MIATIPIEPFRRTFAAASSVVPTRSPKPVLSNVLLVIPDAGPAVLTGGDLEIFLSVDVTGPEFGSPGRILLPAERLRSILGALPKVADLELRTGAADAPTPLLGGQDAGDCKGEPADRTLTIRSGGARWQLATEDPDLYPIVPDPPDSAGTITAGELVRAIRRTSFATDSESTRYALGGVCLEFNPDGCLAVATDGRRLASQVIAASDVWEDIPANPVVPLKACKVLDRLLGGLDGDDPVYIAFDGARAVHFSAAGFRLFARLLEGRFPKWRDVLPKEGHRSVRVNVGSFAAAVAQARIVQSPESRGVTLRVDGAITLSAKTADVGEARAECAIEGDGFADPVEVSLSGDYMAEALGALDEDGSVELRIVDAKLPVVLADDAGCVQVVMPLSKE